MINKYKALFISPHLDDAVFSAGSLAVALTQEGHEVHILTCFTQSVKNPRGFALACQLDKGLPAEIDYMGFRRQEDLEACGILKAIPHWGDLPEAPHRGYNNADELFKNLKKEDQIQQELVGLIPQMMKKIKPQLVLFPVGIGNHVDHQQVIQAMKEVKDSFPEPSYVQWYDQPYLLRNPAEQPQQVQQLNGLDTDQLKKITQTDRSEAFHFTGKSIAKLKLQACAAYKTQINFQFGSIEKLASYFEDDPPGGTKFEEYFVVG